MTTTSVYHEMRGRDAQWPTKSSNAWARALTVTASRVTATRRPRRRARAGRISVGSTKPELRPNRSPDVRRRRPARHSSPHSGGSPNRIRMRRSRRVRLPRKPASRTVRFTGISKTSARRSWPQSTAYVPRSSVRDRRSIHPMGRASRSERASEPGPRRSERRASPVASSRPGTPRSTATPGSRKSGKSACRNASSRSNATSSA